MQNKMKMSKLTVILMAGVFFVGCGNGGGNVAPSKADTTKTLAIYFENDTLKKVDAVYRVDMDSVRLKDTQSLKLSRERVSLYYLPFVDSSGYDSVGKRRIIRLLWNGPVSNKRIVWDAHINLDTFLKAERFQSN